ncbi:predicted protein [Naegleria gruberi]|uniref:Predicted protein n=1 Tax=Naegleria gruberi TaxID=5762 RepID=D2VPA4_NAEGR|nr:uncharacterized protein NAEGRDRAFT_70785 [Naegleria gruberi]EFC41397.1 predicted protein [Naegleria gruberi]|eukprot:XP_002674141.1 predicted protein [Naegleria gruberi strain NEG-M]
MEYIVGNVDFFGRNFNVDSRVLIPRVDSEVLIETTLNQIVPLILKRNGVTNLSQLDRPLRIMEIGVGSGCLLITLLLELEKIGLQKVRAFGIDKSEGALKVATLNAQNLIPKYMELAGKDLKELEFIQHDIFKDDDWIHKDLEMDLIISNPPYIPTNVVQNELDKDVSTHEPHMALDGGLDGFDFYNYLLVDNVLSSKYNLNGHCVMEVGYDQANSLRERIINSRSSLQFLGTAKDLSGYERVVMVETKI